MKTTTRSVEILLVDDEAGIRQGLGDLLAAEGHGVRTANGALAALEELRRRPADLLITDLRMNGPDGLELIRSARTFLPNLDAIVVTGYASLDHAIAAAKLRLLDFIEKPFRVAQVLAAVARCRGRAASDDDETPPNRALDRAAPSAVADAVGRRLEAAGCAPSVASELAAAVADTVRAAFDQMPEDGRVGWGVHREVDAAVVSLRLPADVDAEGVRDRRLVSLFVDDVEVESADGATIVTFRRDGARPRPARGHRLAVDDAENGLAQLRAWIESAEPLTPLRVDLGDCAALSSAALHALDERLDAAREAGHTVDVCHASPAVARAAEALALDTITGAAASADVVTRRALWS